MGKNESGFSLIQVMVAGALMVGVGVFGMKIFQNQGKMTDKIVKDANITEFRLNLITFLNRAETCTNALGGISIGQDFNNLWFTDPDNIFMSVGDKLAGSSQEITSLRLLSDTEAQSAELDVTAAAGDGTKLVYLRIGLRETKDVIGGKDKFIYFKTVATVGDLKIVSGLAYSDTKDLCSTKGGLLYDSSRNHFPSYEDRSKQEPLDWTGSGYIGQCLIPATTNNIVFKCGS